MTRLRFGARVWRLVLALALSLFLVDAAVMPSISYAEICEPGPDGTVDCEDEEKDPGGPGGPGHPGPPTKVPYDTYATPACLHNGPPPTDPGAMCQNATLACQGRGPNGEDAGILMRYYVQWERGGPWELVDTRCSDTDEEQREPSPAEVRREAVERLLPGSDVRMSPPNGEILVNFDGIFYSTADSFSSTFTLLGQQVTLTAQAVRYEWNWGDGTASTETRKGAPFSPGTDKSEYVTHRYTEPGEYTADLTVVWTGTYAVDGGPARALPEMPVQRGTVGQVIARQKLSRLGD